jgi:hypothetical protein
MPVVGQALHRSLPVRLLLTTAPCVVALLGVVAGEGVQVPSTTAPAAVDTRFVGVWRLVSFQSFDATGVARPGAYDLGLIVYDASGRMTAQLMHSSNKADRPLSTDADRATAYRRYLGYWGPFTVDASKGIIVHRVEGSSNPSWVGSDQVRYFSFAEGGRELTLSVKNGERTTSTLRWERVR